MLFEAPSNNVLNKTRYWRKWQVCSSVCFRKWRHRRKWQVLL